ncbi:hypothetical protein [Pararhodobacter sp.]|uniref:hypothetical protein n=1 Tax=Pararhodobacter sp. TaxID=2127056 RepID=UPI002AFF8FC2|nr:hypothetical protein [Pararhodobacter sp.]
MNCLRKRLMALPLVLVTEPVLAQDRTDDDAQIIGNVAAGNDYLFRGLSQTYGHSVLQGGMGGIPGRRICPKARGAWHGEHPTECEGASSSPLATIDRNRWKSRSVRSSGQGKKLNYNVLIDQNVDASCRSRRWPSAITLALYNKPVSKGSGCLPNIHVIMSVGHVTPGRIHSVDLDANGAGKDTGDATMPGLTPEDMQYGEGHNWP